MSQLPTIEENPSGLHQRYTVTKNNGEPTAPDVNYFVLRLDYGGRDITHVEACRTAAREYAYKILDDCEAMHLHQMASELHEYLDSTETH
ncbi:MAG: hypothetical protein AAGD07_25100 [Planctomycetota bacterium]